MNQREVQSRGPGARALLAFAAIVLAGCGSTVKTVTATNPAQPISAHAAGLASTTTASSQATALTASGSEAPSGNSGGTPLPKTVRTQSAPAYAEEGQAPAQLQAAVEVLRGRGYEPVSTSTYIAGHALRVLIGEHATAGDGRAEQAFFFLGGHFLGTDASSPSASISVAGQGDSEVTLAYGLYRPGDRSCCASGGEARVRFVLNNGILQATSAIPAISQRR